MPITVQQLLKNRNPKLLFYSWLLTIGMITAAFLFSPSMTPNAYRLKVEQFEYVEIPDEIQLPPPPREIEPPRDIPTIEVVDGPGDTEIPDNSFPGMDEMPLPPISVNGNTNRRPPVTSRAPELIRRVEASYPEIAREAELEGMVWVKVWIDERGRVYEAEVMRSDAAGILIEAALAAARRCLFRPGSQGPLRVKTQAEIPYRFTIR